MRPETQKTQGFVMAKKPPILVALDLETTGLHAEQDAIVEVAAIKFQGTQVIDTLETLVAPGRSIPYRVQRLTGITSKKLAGAPPFELISKNLQTFLSDFPIVGHSIPFDVGFLRRRGLARTNSLIDTFELATVLLPSLPSYNLGQVAHALNVTVAPDRHRAMVDTVLAMEVYLALHARLDAIDSSLLQELASLDAPRSWPLLNFFKQELRDRQERDGFRGPVRGSLGDRFAAQLGMDPRVLSFAISGRTADTPTVPLSSQDPMDAEVHQNVLNQVKTFVDTPTDAGLKPYENAREQIQQCLQNRTAIMIEAMIGRNDYTPVLVPILEWLVKANLSENQSLPRLIIACANAQGGRRLVEQTLPLLQSLLKSQLSVAYLAERDGYLCIHRWFGAALRRTNGEMSAEQARGMAKLGLWAQQTLTGERNELTLLPHEVTAWARISSGYERTPSADKRSDHMYSRCVYRKKGYCFVARAEARVKAAQIVVTTHAGLLDDLSSSSSLLKDFEHRLILDTDLLEEEISRWSSAELDLTRLQEMLKTAGTDLPEGRYQGLLALAAPSIRENGPGGLSRTLTVGKAELDSRLLNWFQSLRQASTAVEAFFGSLARLLEDAQQETGKGKGRSEGNGRSHNGRFGDRQDQPLRLTPQVRQLESWNQVEQSWNQASQRLQTVIDLLQDVERRILTSQRERRRQDSGSWEEDSLASEFAALAQRLQALQHLGRRAFSFADTDTVYWLRMPPPPAVNQNRHQDGRPEPAVESQPILYAQLAQSSLLVKRLLLPDESSPKSLVLAGIALSVDGNFHFARGRMGLEQESCPAISLVIEHQDQTLIYLPRDVPEPNMPQYQRHLDTAIAQLATSLDGKTVILYTSHAALRSSYSAIKPLLEARGILVLGHGVDGSPRQLWQLFQEQEKIVLLGTGSFWDGIEEINKVPEGIIVSRLPMPVLNDPLMAARAEHISDQLHHFTVPLAAQKLKRALNRIAWSNEQRNVVVLFDRRVVTKEYGSIILHSLPRSSSCQGDVSQMADQVADWLTSAGSWQE